jgi:GNAT superfamily N-acetyltransferase
VDGKKAEYAIRPLDATTWDAFARLAEKHNGVWGGCWCIWFHPHQPKNERGPAGNRIYKERLVRQGKSHAALVFDGDAAVAWCQYGPTDELPNIYHKKEYNAGLTALPDYRITCFFVDRDYRRKGVAAVALSGALELIGQAGGGVVEAYPRDTQGKKTSASFLYSVTRSMFERADFTYERPKGATNCVMRKVVSPIGDSSV